MSNAENCKHGKAAPIEVLGEIEFSQSGEGRHKCAVCAYAAGFAAGRKGTLDEAFEGFKKQFIEIVNSLPMPPESEK
jgi:hypothetical protein